MVVFTIGILPYHCVQAQQDFRCAVRLTFDSDNTGSVANYVLSLQLKNTKGRNVTGASILYKDSQGQVIGNTFLECLNSPEGIKPGSYGDRLSNRMGSICGSSEFDFGAFRLWGPLLDPSGPLGFRNLRGEAWRPSWVPVAPGDVLGRPKSKK